ncbi:MAG: helix-turn-helix domain-containing protein [Caulobacteraceae bacterium]
MTNILRFAEPPGRGPGPDPTQFSALGEYLRAIREHKDLSLVQVAEVTRVRRLYLAAIEAGDLTPLPSRPFAVGYVRAYAKALGLDGDAAVARFKAEYPEAEQQLRAPVGVEQEKGLWRRVIYTGAAVLVAAVGLWNVAQRSLITNAPAGPAMPALAQSWSEPDAKGPIALGAATPPPADQTTPQPYVTPGLGVPGIDANADLNAPPPASPPSSQATAAPIFTPHGEVYGVDAKSGGPVIQAHKSASLLVRGAGGAIVFARELKAGEAYRAPAGRGLTADVSDPAAFDVYVGGHRQGLLSEPQTALDKLAVAPSAPAPARSAAQTAH